MKVGILHNSLNSTGGGERLCLETVEALKEAGHKVVLATVEPTDWIKVKRIMGRTAKPDEERSLLGFRLRMFGIYTRLLTTFLVSKLKKQCDIVINTHGDVLPVSADIVYMHYPTFALLKESPINIKYSESLFWRFYFIPYEAIQNFFIKNFFGGTVLTNSTFSSRAIKRHTGRNAIIVYPPVDTEKFSTATRKNQRENTVVSCGRYTPEKNYEFVLKVAEKLKLKARFMIVGASSGRISTKYYEKLSKAKAKEGLWNVELVRDAPLNLLLNIYGKAKVYLHTMKNEHFGISVVEAMAAGLIPVVHRSGGPWEDILEAKQGVHGFSYISLDEVISAVEEMMGNENLRRNLVETNSRYVDRFSSESFKKKILDIVEQLSADGIWR